MHYVQHPVWIICDTIYICHKLPAQWRNAKNLQKNTSPLLTGKMIEVTWIVVQYGMINNLFLFLFVFASRNVHLFPSRNADLLFALLDGHLFASLA
jgi:hypothetical protein